MFVMPRIICLAVYKIYQSLCGLYIYIYKKRNVHILMWYTYMGHYQNTCTFLLLRNQKTNINQIDWRKHVLHEGTSAFYSFTI
jgi:hypothetical protein